MVKNIRIIDYKGEDPYIRGDTFINIVFMLADEENHLSHSH